MKTKAELKLEAEISALRAQLVAMDEHMTRGTDLGRMRAYEAALKLIAADHAARFGLNTEARHLRGIAARALEPLESQLKFHGIQCRAQQAFSSRCALHAGHGGAHYDGVHSWSMKRRGRGLETVLNATEVEHAERSWSGS